MKRSVKVQLCILIVDESFGKLLSQVTKFLLNRDRSSLRLIAKEASLPLKQVN